MGTPDLRELQRLFWRSLTAAPETELVELIPPRPKLAPAERLDVYVGMYFHRLLDVLREDYPRSAAILGEASFEALVRAYLTAHPSQHPSVRHLGGELPAFLAANPPSDTPAFVADLARLEWARIEVFDAPDTKPLTLAHLEQVPAEQQAAQQLALIPAFELLSLDWPVHKAWAAEPNAVPDLVAERTLLRVWRRDFAVYHARVDALEEAALRPLTRGASFADVCEAVAERATSEEEAATTAASLLLRWLEDGILARTAPLTSGARGARVELHDRRWGSRPVLEAAEKAGKGLLTPRT
jgi:hypothetical protein